MLPIPPVTTHPGDDSTSSIHGASSLTSLHSTDMEGVYSCIWKTIVIHISKSY